MVCLALLRAGVCPSSSFSGPQSFSSLTHFSLYSLATIFVSRIMLNLRALYFADPPHSSESAAWRASDNIASSIRFVASRASARVVGNFGATLEIDAGSIHTACDRDREGGSGGARHDQASDRCSPQAEAGIASARAGSSVSPLVQRRPVIHEEEGKGIDEDPHDYQVDSEKEWWEDEKEAFVQSPFSAGLLGPRMSLVHAEITACTGYRASERVDGGEIVTMNAAATNDVSIVAYGGLEIDLRHRITRTL